MKKKKMPVMMHGAFKTQADAQNAMGKGVQNHPTRKFSIKKTKTGRYAVMSRV